MSRPDPRSQAAQAAMSAAFSRAVDLSALRERPPAAAPGGAADGAGERSPYIMDVTEAMFNQVVQASTQVLVVLDLWSPRSELSRQLSPMLERLAEQGNGTWVLAHIDVDAQVRIAQALGVQSVPTVMALAGGQPVSAIPGDSTEPEVQTWIADLINQLRDRLPGIKAAEDAAGPAAPEAEDPRLTRAHQATDAGDYAAAAEAYREVLAEQPAHAEAASGLAWSEFLGRVSGHADDVTARSDTDPADVSLALDAADVEVASGRSADGFARLIALIGRTAGADRDRARDHLLSLFSLFATDDPDVMSARRALAAALY